MQHFRMQHHFFTSGEGSIRARSSNREAKSGQARSRARPDTDSPSAVMCGSTAEEGASETWAVVFAPGLMMLLLLPPPPPPAVVNEAVVELTSADKEAADVDDKASARFLRALRATKSLSKVHFGCTFTRPVCASGGGGGGINPPPSIPKAEHPAARTREQHHSIRLDTRVREKNMWE